jgi:hypothetical protein
VRADKAIGGGPADVTSRANAMGDADGAAVDLVCGGGRPDRRGARDGDPVVGRPSDREAALPGAARAGSVGSNGRHRRRVEGSPARPTAPAPSSGTPEVQPDRRV